MDGKHICDMNGSILSFSANKRAQSAMEYLMTYGWAILIMAVVLGVLFQLGVFGSANFAPKARAGQCQVQVVGSGSSTTHQLAGLCSPELPQYVAQFSNPTAMASMINLGPFSVTVCNYTTTAWAYETGIAPGYGSWGSPFVFIEYTSGGANQVWDQVDINDNSIDFSLVNKTKAGGSFTLPTAQVQLNPSPKDRWLFIATGSSFTGNAFVYVNGVQVWNGPSTGCMYSQTSQRIGGDSFNGFVSNVQYYNKSLSLQEVDALYLDGIGAAPIAPSYVIGWWPLNGNANDYGGNNFNPTSVVNTMYSGTWTTTYTAP